MKKIYTVSGMTCAGCVKTVKALLGTVPGVAVEEVSLEKQIAKVDLPDHVTLSDLQEKLKNFPYRMDEVK